MSNGRVAALSEGLTYQGLIFWQYAFKMLVTDNEIACVTYEEQKTEKYVGRTDGGKTAFG